MTQIINTHTGNESTEQSFSHCSSVMAWLVHCSVISCSCSYLNHGRKELRGTNKSNSVQVSLS